MGQRPLAPRTENTALSFDGCIGRLSGAQTKLPVSLFRGSAGETIRIGDLRHACTHTLKIPVGQFPHLVENEWATMEVARRIGLRRE